MPIRSACLGVASAVVLLAPSSASADSPHSINHIVTDNLPFEDCMRRASATMKTAGLRQFATTSEAVWAVTSDNNYMASVYCLRTRDVAVVAASGAERSRNHSLVESIVAAWKRTR